MRIGLDIDNVVADFDSKVLEEFLKEDKKKRNSGIVNPNARWVGALFDWSREEIEEFLANNMQEIAKVLKPRKDAKKYMDKFLEDGHTLHLISHRVAPHYTTPFEVTENWLREHQINYTKLILSESTNKSQECKENGIDVMIDDERSNCHKLNKGGVKCFLMQTEYNKSDPQGLDMVHDWEDLYRTISEL